MATVRDGRVSVAGTPVVTLAPQPPFTIAVSPGSGATLTVEFQLFENGDWYPWAPGPVSAKTIQTVNSRVRRVRFTRTVAGSTGSFGEIF